EKCVKEVRRLDAALLHVFLGLDQHGRATNLVPDDTELVNQRVVVRNLEVTCMDLLTQLVIPVGACVVPACVIGTGRVTHHVVDDCLWEQPLQHVRNTSADTNSVHTEVAAADSLCVPSNPLSGLYGVKASPRVQNLGVLSVTDKRDVLVRTEPRNVNTHDGRCVLVLLPLGL